MAHTIIDTVYDKFGNTYSTGVYVKNFPYTNKIDPDIGNFTLPFELKFYKDKTSFIEGYKNIIVINNQQNKNVINNYSRTLTFDEAVNNLNRGILEEYVKGYLETVFGENKVVDFVVEDATNTPPTTPSGNTAYLVTSVSGATTTETGVTIVTSGVTGATAEWANKEVYVATYSAETTSWLFIEPFENMQVYDGQTVYTYSSGSWVSTTSS